jgi:hypothetical protein
LLMIAVRVGGAVIHGLRAMRAGFGKPVTAP